MLVRCLTPTRGHPKWIGAMEVMSPRPCLGQATLVSDCGLPPAAPAEQVERYLGTLCLVILRTSSVEAGRVEEPNHIGKQAR
jgi:hypothetical protein